MRKPCDPRARSTNSEGGSVMGRMVQDLRTDAERKLDAMTLADVWPLVVRAWLARRRAPIRWRALVGALPTWPR